MSERLFFENIEELQRIRWRTHPGTVIEVEDDYLKIDLDKDPNPTEPLRLHQHQVDGGEPLVELLICEDPTMRAEVEASCSEHGSQVDFEHGQWFVTNVETGAQWSVIDTSGGLDFEQVSDGDDQ